MEYNAARLDLLKELGNIGAGHATTALSRLLGDKRLQLIVPEAMVLDFQETMELWGGPEQVVAAVYVVVSGNISGHMALILPLACAQSLLTYLLGTPRSELDEMDLSALQEMGNIVVTSYLNALADLTEMSLYPSVPAVAIDMVAAVWSSILAETDFADYVTLIRTTFETDDDRIEGTIAFIPETTYLTKVLASLGMEDI
ncbi:MAG: chemotaxis protein CheC [Limnochordia bacterium]|jgi:chemotaxis protein CheC